MKCSVCALGERCGHLDAAQHRGAALKALEAFDEDWEHLIRLQFGEPLAARWVATQNWHSKQKGWFEASGSYCLSVPYSDDRELVMDILKYGPDVEVLEPEALRKRVAGQLGKAAKLYC